MTTESPHALYRFYDADGVLLYVGITVDPGVRFKKHYADKPWWSEIASIKIEQFPDRGAVLRAEEDAIWAEKPLHNVVHSEAAQALRRATANVYDQYGRLTVCIDPKWRVLATAYPQLLALEDWVESVGLSYMADNHSHYVCGQAFWYGYGNARTFFDNAYLSPKTAVGAVAGADDDEPLLEGGLREVSFVVASLTRGFVRVALTKGWRPPADLKTEEAYIAVYQRMYALMPRCYGPCPCVAREEYEE